MADRVSVTIRIGGSLPRAKLAEFIAVIESYALTDWLGEYFHLDRITGLEPLELGAHEVAWGRLDDLEDFCVANGLPFQRWCGSYAGSWEAERIMFDGTADPRSYTVTENDIVVVTEPEVRSLGTFEAIGAYLQSASLELPPLTIIDEEEQVHG
jgi:hypothetical protein